LLDVAHDLAVTIPQAGLLVSGYALGVAFAAPILAVATAHLDRRHSIGKIAADRKRDLMSSGSPPSSFRSGC
jgi:predicted MFS family arabinose efflux permease